MTVVVPLSTLFPLLHRVNHESHPWTSPADIIYLDDNFIDQFIFTSFLGEMPQTPICPTEICFNLPVTDCHLVPRTFVPLRKFFPFKNISKSKLIYFAPVLLHTVSFLSTAQQTPVGPTLMMFFRCYLLMICWKCRTWLFSCFLQF